MPPCVTLVGLLSLVFVWRCMSVAGFMIHGVGNARALRRTISQDTLVTEVAEADSLSRLDVFLAKSFNQYSRSFFGALCDAEKVRVNNCMQPKAHRVALGDRVEVEVVDERKNLTTVQAENIPLSILFEDEHLVVVDKPDGMVVHPAPGTPNGTFANALLHHLGVVAAAPLLQNPVRLDDEDEPPNGDEAEDFKLAAHFLRPGIVHRLDKGTTGVLLAGKHPVAVEKLSRCFAQREVSKVYLAVCVGHPGDVTMRHCIGRDPRNRQVMTILTSPPGKPATTHTRTLAFNGKLSVVLVRIETGRTHQIRVHLKGRRTPILGDDVYGSKQWNRRYALSHHVTRPLLHAYEMRLAHPFVERELLLRAPLPRDLRDLVVEIGSQDLIHDADQQPMVDPASGFLRLDTEVHAQAPAAEGADSGGTPVVRSSRALSRGYVPAERILGPIDDDSTWLSQDLPEELLATPAPAHVPWR